MTTKVAKHPGLITNFHGNTVRLSNVTLEYYAKRLRLILLGGKHVYIQNKKRKEG